MTLSKNDIFLVFFQADMMLNKDVLENLGDSLTFKEQNHIPYIPRITPPKRVPDPGAILSWAIPAANRV
jgi:hypothetical protein